jgi:DNA repair protein RadC
MSYAVKDIPKLERPQEKLIKYGPQRLKDEELLALILRTGRRGQNVIDIASEILEKHPLHQNSYKIDNLTEIKGVGTSKAVQILASIELGKRLFQKSSRKLVSTPEDVWKETQSIHEEKKEWLVALFLDSRRQLIAKETISIGTVTSSLIHPREVYEPAVIHSAVFVILVHNHPSGSLEPSMDDVLATEKVMKAGKILGIELIDHVIVTKAGFYSFIREVA